MTVGLFLSGLDISPFHLSKNTKNFISKFFTNFQKLELVTILEILDALVLGRLMETTTKTTILIIILITIVRFKSEAAYLAIFLVKVQFGQMLFFKNQKANFKQRNGQFQTTSSDKNFNFDRNFTLITMVQTVFVDFDQNNPCLKFVSFSANISVHVITPKFHKKTKQDRSQKILFFHPSLEKS